MAVLIRTATSADVESLAALDVTTEGELGSPDRIRSWVDAGSTVIAQVEGRPAGFAVLEHSFFGQGFVAMLQVAPSFRRRGIGTALLRHLEGTCRAPKLFTSTNESNAPMRALLASMGYEPSGVVHNLDEGDPELFFFRRLRV